MTNERHEKALEAAEWIEHDGNGIPVDGETIVTVMFGHNNTESSEPCEADQWSWDWDRPYVDRIIAYRLVTNHFTNGE